MKPEHYSSLSEMWLNFVPEYKSKSYRPFYVSFPWDQKYSDLSWEISSSRCDKRLKSYLIPGEFDRSKGSLRFGLSKTGRGYQGERGEFCLLASHLEKGHLTVFYRNVELIGGLHFDFPIFNEIEDRLGPVKKISLFATKAFVFGVHGKKSFTKERLYERVSAFHRKEVS